MDECRHPWISTRVTTGPGSHNCCYLLYLVSVERAIRTPATRGGLITVTVCRRQHHLRTPVWRRLKAGLQKAIAGVSGRRRGDLDSTNDDCQCSHGEGRNQVRQIVLLEQKNAGIIKKSKANGTPSIRLR